MVAVLPGRTLKVTSDGTEKETVFEGWERDVKKASAVARLGFDIRMDFGFPGSGPTIRAGFDSILGIAAAMASINPQDFYFQDSPQEVRDLIRANSSSCRPVKDWI
jgi:hypothetical protein